MGNRVVQASVVLGMCVAAGACGSSGTKAPAPTSRSTTTRRSTTSSSAAGTTTTTPVTITTHAGSWSLVPAAPAALGPPVAWTGTEVLSAKSGCCDDLGSVQLSAYDPERNAWHELPHTPLTPRAGAAGVWTGSEMVIAGGLASTSGSAAHANEVTDGAAWDARTNAWHAIAPMPAPLAEASTNAVWTGREMLVWSSSPTSFETNAGGHEVVLAYNPATNTWRRLPRSGLAPRDGAIVVWTGHELVVWGGRDAAASHTYGDGARLDPATGVWHRLPAAPVPARGLATAVWSGREVLLWGGQGADGKDVGQGAAYDPATDSWRALPASPLRARALAASAWTGRHFIVVGGSEQGRMPVPGPGAAAYDPATNSWTALPAAPEEPRPWGPGYTADQREDANAVWTGKAMVVVGGRVDSMQAYNPDGVVWTPAA